MMKKILFTIFSTLAVSAAVFAGNPDRQGEAGAYELLINPWARSAGFGNLVTANVSGNEAMFVNPAGLGRVSGMQISLAHTRYLVGSGVSLSAASFSKSIGDGAGVFGISITNVNFGSIQVTTTNLPEGVPGQTFTPNFLNIGLSYAKVFSERIVCAFTVRAISEQISNAMATGISFDAGVQYTSGENDEVHLGISLKNVGTKMDFKGDGLSNLNTVQNNNGTSILTVDRDAASFEQPTQVNIGVAYDLFPAGKTADEPAQQRVTLAANFTGNSFTKDQLGLGVEYAFKEMFMARVAYKVEAGQFNADSRTNAETGLTAGVSVEVPVSKKDAEQQRKLSIDYGFRMTNPYAGTHLVGLTFNF